MHKPGTWEQNSRRHEQVSCRYIAHKRLAVPRPSVCAVWIFLLNANQWALYLLNGVEHWHCTPAAGLKQLHQLALKDNKFSVCSWGPSMAARWGKKGKYEIENLKKKKFSPKSQMCAQKCFYWSVWKVVPMVQTVTVTVLIYIFTRFKLTSLTHFRRNEECHLP